MEVENTTPKENPVIIRPSFKKICNNDACRAALYNQLLYCVASKVAKGGEYWYGTLDAIYHDIDESWSMSKMRKELEELVNQGIIGQRHNQEKKWDRTLQYFFGKKEAEKLKALCKKNSVDLSKIGLPSCITHLLYLTNASDEINKCNCQICQMHLLNKTDPFVKNNRAIPKVTTKVTSEVTTKVTYGEQSDNTEKGASAPVVTDQHTSSLFSENELPPMETTEPPVSPNGQKPTKPERPAGKETNKKRNVTVTEPPEKPKTGLDAHTEQEKAFWQLWLNADQNKKVPPQYKDSASDHIKTLAPQITTQEQMDSLVSFSREKTRKKLNLPSLWKIELGNLRNCFPDWDKAQSSGPGEATQKDVSKMSQDELRDYALSFPPRLEHHTPAYKELQRCLDRLLPDNKKEVVRKRFEVQHQTTAIAS